MDVASMISERTFSEYYPSFWRELLPGGMRYIKFINGGASRRVADSITPCSRKDIRSLISQVAFYLLRNSFSSSDLILLSNEQLLGTDYWNSALDAAIKFISRFPDKPTIMDLSSEEATDSLNLARAMYKYIKTKDNCDDIIFEPEFPGWGLLNSAKADILSGNNLIEIKAVEGSFGIHDIRQVLVYGTLNFLTETYSALDSFELYNPRIGKSYKDSFEILAQSTAGCSAEELFIEISNYITDKITSL